MHLFKLTDEELDLLIEAVNERGFTLKYRDKENEFDERLILFRLRNRFGKHKFRKVKE